MPLLTSPAAVHAAFTALPRDPATGTPSRAALAALVAAHFGAPGSDGEPFAPPDATAPLPPASLPAVADPAVRASAAGVHALWPALCRRPAQGGGSGSGSPAPPPPPLVHPAPHARLERRPG